MNYHYPVLSREVIRSLEPQANQNFLDCTLGDGGHTEAILKLTGPEGKVLGIDLDARAIKTAEERLGSYKKRLIIARDNFKNLKQIIYGHGFIPINGILLDLGFSRGELEDQSRGFSFLTDAPLDMRFDIREKLTAEEVVNGYGAEELQNIFKNYGEERFAKRIAGAILNARKLKRIKTTLELVEIIKSSVPANYSHKKIHPATRVFQALRIEVNDELNNLKTVLPQAGEILESGGRLAVISFHSLEDRLVKNFFKEESTDCICPKDFPVCRCGHKASVKLLTKKPIIPSVAEIKENPPSRSAKLRAVEKL